MASLSKTQVPHEKTPSTATPLRANVSFTIQGISTTIATADIVVEFSAKGADPTPESVENLLAQANHKQRIQIIWDAQDPAGSKHSTKNPDIYDSLLPGERILSAFLLRITGDTHLETGWDTKLITSWIQTDDENAVLSCSHQAGQPQVMAPESWIDTHHLLCKPHTPPPQATNNGATRDNQAVPAAFLNPGFLFGPFRLALELNYIHDTQQSQPRQDVESALVWMAGFNLYHPLIPLLRPESPATEPWLVAVPEPDAQAPMRSGGEYQRWAGISSQPPSICGAARQGLFPAWAHRSYATTASIRLQGAGFLVVDDFLEEDLYQDLRDQLVCDDYQHINTSGPIQRAWHIQDRFPLRSTTNWFFDPRQDLRQASLPLDVQAAAITPLDGFMQAVFDFQQQHIPFIGQHGSDWQDFSTTAWIYPPGTGLSMHNDGVNVYRGAYAYFLNDEWRSHWGGLLIVMDQAVNRAVQEHENHTDPQIWYRRRWLHENELEQLMLEAGGLGTCIFPRRNRIVFLDGNVYHMVTRINEEAGDHLRLSLAGFFNVKKKGGMERHNKQ